MLIVKSLHIIFMVSWFAALFYLPRLFVYHAMAEDKISLDRFVVMENKLFRAIGTPAMILTIIFGFWTVYLTNNIYYSQLWFQIKLALVGLLVAYHFMCFHFMKQLENQSCKYNHVFFRFFNEAPVILLITVVFLVVLKRAF